jgi:hypothetical protein
MRTRAILTVFLFAAIAGCMGASNIRKPSPAAGRVDSPSAFLSLKERQAAWKQSDRCTQCHMVWSWEYGYYRGWDRHGLISDYTLLSPAGYKDPWGLDVPVNSFREYYFTDWWKGSWLDERIQTAPVMHLDGYGPPNEGRSKPGDFNGEVIVVDQKGGGAARTIQEGVDRAKRGATVFVRAGRYKESVRLGEGIRLWGENPRTTIIDSGTDKSGIIAANGCDISGFTITGSGMDYDRLVFTAGIHVLDCDSTLVIRGNIFYSNAVFGVLVESSRTSGTPAHSLERYIAPEHALSPLAYSGYPNPRIIGNTFHMIGERAVYCIHSSPEIANNIFMGNVKTVGMTQLSRPFIHHNVFYRNNVPLNINRSMPVVCNNIMVRNYWGQRVIEGSSPVIHDNITWESPWYREFGEDGRPIPFVPFPGTGELTVNPAFVNPDSGDFNLSPSSPVKRPFGALNGYGLVRGYGIQCPPVVPCSESWAEIFLARNDTTRAVLAAVDSQNDRIRSLDVSYTIEYRSFMSVDFDRAGNQCAVSIVKSPVSGTDYRAHVSMTGDTRRKTYRMARFAGKETAADSGTVFFDGERVRVSGGVFNTESKLIDDTRGVGERPVRENPGGLLLDYDQYLNGAIGPGGTFFYGFLRILGGEAIPRREKVDGRECIVIKYPHLGADQKYVFSLDPAIGYRPIRIQHFFERRLFREIDGYRYEEVGGMFFPVTATITDYVVRGPFAGKVAGTCVMKVTPGSLRVNGGGK